MNWPSSPLCCCGFVLYKITCKFHILLSWPLSSFQRTHQEGKGAMKFRYCRTVVCRLAVSTLKQLAPSKFAPSKGGTVVKWLLLPRNFARFTLRKSLGYVEGCTNTNRSAPALKQLRFYPLLQKRLTFTTYRK